MVGNQVLDFTQGIGNITTHALPTSTEPGINDAYEYQGQVPAYSQNVQCDDTGDVLFFIVDGTVYNRDGLLIADNVDGVNGSACVDCLFKGRSRMAIIPVQNSCTRYYIVTGELTGDFVLLRYGMLDLALPNSNVAYASSGFPVMGRFINAEDDAFYDYHWEGYFVEDQEPFSMHEIAATDSHMPEHLRFDVAQLTDDRGYLFMLESRQMLVSMLFRGNGVFLTGNFPKTAANNLEILYEVLDQGNNSARGELEVIQKGTKARVAYSSYWLNGDFIPAHHTLAICFWEFDLTNIGDVAPTLGFQWSNQYPVNPWMHSMDEYDEIPGELDQFGNLIEEPRISGLEFSPNGRYLYYIKSTHRAAPNHPDYPNEPRSNFGYFDFEAGLGVWPNNGIAFAPVELTQEVADSELEFNQSLDGTSKVLYCIRNNGQGQYTLEGFFDPDNPSVTNWDGPQVVLPSVALGAEALGLVEHRLLSTRVTNSDHWQYLQQPLCCEAMAAIKDRSGSAPLGTQNWVVGNNPFFNEQGPVYVATELRIPLGAHVNATNMEFRFGPGATLIIEPGGSFQAVNCTMTNACGGRWAGIRVNGTTTADQSPLIGGDQGYLRLSGSTVSSAVVGAQTLTQLTGGGADPNGYGGVIIATQSTFKNCVTGVDIDEYHGHFSSGVENNLCRFSYVNFITDSDWPDALAPQWHANLHNTRKIDFFYCNFRNDDATAFGYYQRGGGVKASSAEVSVLGGGSLAGGSIQNLTYGFFRIGDPLVPSTVNNMFVYFNHRGVMDVNGMLGRYTNNTFLVPDQATNATAPAGLTLWQSRFFTVERNTFNGMPFRDRSIGILFKGISPDQSTDWVYDDERIYDNVFNNLHSGCLVNGMHRSDDGTNDDNGLRIFCGDYTNNVHDIALADRSIIKPNQFDNGLEYQLAGNRFYGAANCSSEYDWILGDNWNVNVGDYDGMEIVYRRHDEALHSASCPDPVEDNFINEPVVTNNPFDKTLDCAGGALDRNRTPGQAKAAYSEAKALNLGVKSLLDGTTDGGERPDLLAELAQDDPWLGTGFLRDRLMLNSPLSNRVLQAMIAREQPMDQWHITQVCLQNTPLDPGVLGLLRGSGVLSEFFYNVVTQAQVGQGPSTKQLLQQEWMLRRSQQAEAFVDLGYLWATDTINLDGDYSLRQEIAETSGLDMRLAHFAAQLEGNDLEGAEASYEGLEKNQSGYEKFRSVLDMAQAHDGNWTLLDSAEVDSLWNWAVEGYQGAALFAGILASNGHGSVDVEPRFPVKTKSRFIGAETTTSSALSGLTILPVPADNEVMCVFPPQYKGEVFTVQDALGAIVRNGVLESAGTHRIPTVDLANGVYSVTLDRSGLIGRIVVRH